MKIDKEGPHTASAKTIVIDDGKGNLQYCKVGKNMSMLLHRDNGPAIDYKNGFKAHYKNGLRHGTIEFAGRICSTWENGVKLS